ncbi:hypothetical protein B0I26_11739 [Anoxybacillus vitaminiphilus]|uniref:Uncharacterized protein n=1 Tax=Paranoxybacillus vitaminiphilus TaxID=581036 RepID=A0A327YA14_9BACL|nr:hypothetical protein [Anoxybacillus vitaminiphilus]RAK16625.1 hypothetical protein B0I26_11739 [Anoxybacillus vitaminiphilus]
MEVIVLFGLVFFLVFVIYSVLSQAPGQGRKGRNSDSYLLPPYYHDTSSDYNDCIGGFGGDCGSGGDGGS